MSFILDALRKSESRRNKGQTPGLESQQAPVPRRRRRPGVLTVLLGLAVVVAVAAAGVVLTGPEWVRDELAALTGGRDDAAPPDEPAPAAVAPLTVETDPAAPSGEEDTPTEDASRTRERATARIEERQSPEPTEAEPEPNETVAPTDRRRARPASPERSISRPAPQRESAPVSSEQATEELERRLAEARARVRNAVRDEAGESEASDAGDEPSAGTATPSEAETGQAEAPEYVRAWELPLSARRSMPDLTLTLHVFAQEEEQRFVLINGERYRAGDEIGDNVRLVDIRREGAVIDFKEHRFLLEP